MNRFAELKERKIQSVSLEIDLIITGIDKPFITVSSKHVNVSFNVDIASGIELTEYRNLIVNAFNVTHDNIRMTVCPYDEHEIVVCYRVNL